MSEGLRVGGRLSDRLEAELGDVDGDFVEILRKVPLRDDGHLPPDWLHWEMLERHRVLGEAGLERGTHPLEVGSGAHAIATVPLAHAVGPEGRVVALERERWAFFRQIAEAAEMVSRVVPVAGDARKLPFPSDAFDLAVCVHGVRSLRHEATMTAVFREMLRVAPRLFLAESLPIARNEAQRAHLAMYNLREEVFEAVLGHKDDIHYPPLERVAERVSEAGGGDVETRVLELGLPHYLAFLPREYVARIEDEGVRDDLLRRWGQAKRLLDAHGAEHPPVGIVRAVRAQG